MMTHPRSNEIDLAITGMTCASCAARIEKRLNELDGVTATVNYATERANIHAVDGVTVDELMRRSKEPATKLATRGPQRRARSPSRNRTRACRCVSA